MISLFCFTVLSITGIPILFFLHKGETFLGVSRHIWGTFHERLGMFMIFLLLCHLFLHGKWLISAFNGKFFSSSKEKGKIWASVIVSLLIFILIAVSSFS
jgi:hypothetical protein